MVATAALAYPLQSLAEPSQATGEAEQVAAAIAATTEAQGRLQGPEPEAVVDNLDWAAQRFEEAVQDVETLVVAAQEESREAPPNRRSDLSEIDAPWYWKRQARSDTQQGERGAPS